jgi:hypothetical protein
MNASNRPASRYDRSASNSTRRGAHGMASPWGMYVAVYGLDNPGTTQASPPTHAGRPTGLRS